MSCYFYKWDWPSCNLCAEKIWGHNFHHILSDCVHISHMPGFLGQDNQIQKQPGQNLGSSEVLCAYEKAQGRPVSASLAGGRVG